MFKNYQPLINKLITVWVKLKTSHSEFEAKELGYVMDQLHAWQSQDNQEIEEMGDELPNLEAPELVADVAKFYPRGGKAYETEVDSSGRRLFKPLQRTKAKKPHKTPSKTNKGLQCLNHAKYDPTCGWCVEIRLHTKVLDGIRK